MFPETNKILIPQSSNGFLSKKAHKSELSRNVNIRIEKSVWTSLKNLKKRNETFNDVILGLLNERSKEISTKSMTAIDYSRKTDFVSVSDSLGFQFEYNDVKSLSSFIIDLEIKKVFYGKASHNASFFFGLPNKFFFCSEIYLKFYFILLTSVLNKEFGVKVNLSENSLFNLVNWKKIYFDYGLSEESFKNDIENPLSWNETENITEKEKQAIKDSPSFKMSW